MKQYIDKSALVAEITHKIKVLEAFIKNFDGISDKVEKAKNKIEELGDTLLFIETLEVKEVGVWKTVDNINTPQADRNKIYCVFTKQRYILAKVIDHPQDDDLLQWKCTEFPNHRYDMCEGDKYMQIV